MVIGDAVGTHKPCPGQSQLKFSPTFDSVQQRGEGVVVAWRAEQEIRPGKYSLNDFNFETPGTKLLVSEPSRINQGGNQALEIYDYPGEYDSRSEGEDYVRARIEEEEVPHAIFSGSSDCRMLESGFHFELAGFDHFKRGRTDQNGEYLLVSIIHNGRQVGLTLDRPADNNVPYSNSFTCIPLSVPFRPPRVTPRPLVQGTQTAIVVGPKGEEIFTDKYGRVKVQFHWDREGKHDENTTCFIRVSQPWAGKNWGAINIPRIGQEVIVDFLEGDPDQPIIVGRVYNASQMPPYELPANQTRTTFLTRSSKNGSTSNFNELRFEDKKDDEQIFLNAEKDMDWRVEKESREFVGASRHLQVNASQLESVGGDKHSEVAGKHFEKVKGDTSIHLCAKCMEQVDSDQSLQVGGDRKEQITGNDSLTVGQNRKEKVGQNESITIGQNRDVKVGMNDALSASQAVYITGGMNVVIQAGMQLSLVGPGGFIDIGPAGVSIQGTMVLINSGGAPGSAQSASPDSPDSPDQPDDPKGPDTADDGSKGGKLNQ